MEEDFVEKHEFQELDEYVDKIEERVSDAEFWQSNATDVIRNLIDVIRAMTKDKDVLKKLDDIHKEVMENL